MIKILDLLINLIKSMSVVILLAYTVTRTRIYSEFISSGKVKIKQQLMLVAVFGIFSIFGTLGGINFNGAIANIRDLGPAIAGLIGGPLVGLGAGLIGGIHRFFLGGITYIPCSISTVLAGLTGGLIHYFRKGKFTDILGSVIFMALMEVFHMGFTLLVVKPFSTIWPIIKSVSLPMILTNALGMGMFTFIVKNLIQERQTQRAKELIEGELNVARMIQMSIVPKIFPPFPERIEFDIFAVIEPAREVGGDFYDFFLLDEDLLCFAIGDVSGKGVPASLFMAVTKTLLKAKSVIGMGPDEILYQVNNELNRDNDSGMFVTIFFGILTISTGEFVYSNGGHNGPYLRRANGKIEPIVQIGGMALAVMENKQYKSSRTIMEHGDRLVLYTDGVTEAMNKAGDLLGEEPLVDMLQNVSGNTAKETVQHIINETRKFVNGADQSDDITLMVIQYFGLKQMVHRLAGELKEISVLGEKIDKFAQKNRLPPGLAFQVNLSLDELITNAITYGFQNVKKKEIIVKLTIGKKNLAVEMRDNAIPFNPLDRVEPDTMQNIDKREIGGLGIHIVRKMMDDIQYRFEDGYNILTLKKFY